MKIIGSPHPPTPSPKLGRRGAGANSGVSYSLECPQGYNLGEGWGEGIQHISRDRHQS
jgi:hypothetical protein